MENEFSILYSKTYNSVYKKVENEIKLEIQNQYDKYAGFTTVYDLTRSEIKRKIENLQINKSDKFKPVIAWYGLRYDKKREGFECLIFEDEMQKEFQSINGIDKNFTFLKFIEEFASNNAFIDLSRSWNHFKTVYEFMYKLNDFTEFGLWNYNGNHENHPMFKKYWELIYGSKEKAQIDKKNVSIDFKIKRKYKNILGKLYDDLKSDFINTDLTSKEDFKNVLTKSSEEHKSKIYFSNFDYYSANILRKMEPIFNQLNYTNIGKSGLIFSKNKKPFTQNKLSQGISRFEKNQEQLKKYKPFIDLNSKIIKGLESIK